MLSGKKLKKAPIPEYYFEDEPYSQKLFYIIQNKFRNLFQTSNLNSSQRKKWGEFLQERNIYWEFLVPSKFISSISAWDGWEVCRMTKYGSTYLVARPTMLEDHIKVSHFYVPKDLALKMLVLGELA